MGQPWQIEMFGWLRVVQSDRVVSRFRTHKTGVLLAYLAYYQHRSHPREQLIELLWPGGAPSAGRANLRGELPSLRRQLEPPGVAYGAVLLASGDTLQLNPAACATDVAAFEAALAAAERTGSPAERAQHLLTASELYRGELLPGYFEEWILPERQRLAEAHLEALHGLVVLLEEMGERPQALQWARRAVAADPLCEESHHDLIRLLVAAGQFEAARAQYEQGEQLLEQELGATLSPEIHALVKSLPIAKEHPSPVQSVEQRRRRGGSSPEPGAEPSFSGIEAGPANGATGVIPRAEPLPAAARPTHRLPLRFNRFFGREAEITALVGLLSGDHHGDTETRRSMRSEDVGSDDVRAATHPLNSSSVTPSSSVSPCLRGDLPSPCGTTRLLTLTGPGGTGKTRLAQQVAERLRGAFPGGVWFVPLQELTDPALIPDQILLGLRLPRSPEQQALEHVVACLSRAPALLVLDNFEHLVDGGAEIVRDLLEQVEHLTVLVTSRQRLGLEGEREFGVGPLPVPAEAGVEVLRCWGVGERHVRPFNAPTPQHLNALAACPSVALFVDRAQAVRPDFQVTAHNAAAVAALCQRLEGLPLAIELAAARATVLTPQQMLARLERRFELLVGRQRAVDARHRSLWATLDWSYQLLSPELQRFFAQLSVFRGGWTLEAAEVVCDEPLALAYLEQLRESSFVVSEESAGGMRYRMLETIREFAHERLAESDEGERLRRRHAEFFLALAETAELELTGRDQGLWLDRLEREHDNLRAALAWSIGSRESQLGLQLGGVLQEFWDARGYLKEGADQLLLILRQPGAEAPTAARAKALDGAGRFVSRQGDLEAARALHEESLAIWRGLQDRAGMAVSLRYLGGLTFQQWDVTAGRALIEESLAICRELGDQRGIAETLHELGWSISVGWDLVEARAISEESLAIWRELDDRGGIVAALERLGVITFYLGENDMARVVFEEELTRATNLGDKLHIAWSLMHLGWVTHREDDPALACTLYEQSLVIWRDLDAKEGLIHTLFDYGYAVRARGNYPAAHAILAEAVALSRQWGSSRYLAYTLAHLGMVAGDLGDWEQAAAHLTEGLGVCRQSERRDQLAIARCLLGLARRALANAKPARATRLLGASEALRARCSFSAWPFERRECDRNVSTARAQLDEAEFAAAWSEGEAMPLDDAIALALEEITGG